MKMQLFGIALLMAFGAATITSAGAQQPTQKYTSTIGTVELSTDNTYQDLPKLDTSQQLATHRYSLLLPKGATLHPVADEQGERYLHAEIIVKDSKGRIIGTVDSAWAQDDSGASLATFFTIEGQTLVQTVDTSNAAGSSATAVLMYSGINSQEIAARAAGPQPKAYIGIPSNYRYGTQYSPRSLHDYCTSSPDEYPNTFGANANFRGPCARHDMCYEAHVAGKSACDNNLWSHMVSNCKHTYGTYNPVRQTCISTAHVYWVAVKSFGGY